MLKDVQDRRLLGDVLGVELGLLRLGESLLGDKLGLLINLVGTSVATTSIEEIG